MQVPEQKHAITEDAYLQEQQEVLQSVAPYVPDLCGQMQPHTLFSICYQIWDSKMHNSKPHSRSGADSTHEMQWRYSKEVLLVEGHEGAFFLYNARPTNSSVTVKTSTGE